ncbi:hypothetical protein ES319_D02G046700v1 [Gossypium barbadense]|nr:hypothetical protein ES319_D02G046700v1 [Gossypium barbadense]
MIPVDKELSMIESGYEEEAKGQGHLVPAAEDKDTRNETESATLQHDGLASPCIKDGEHDEKEQDSSTILDVEEMPLKEAARTEETNAEACLVPAGGDESTCGTETGQVSGDRGGKEYPSVDKQKPDEKEACQVPAGGDESNRGTETGQVSGDRGGMEYPSVDKQTPDEKEEDITVNDETEEQSSQEAASTDVLDRQVQLLPVVEDKATHGNQIGFVTSDPKGTADLNGDNPKEHEKEEDTNMIQVDKENSMKEAGYADDAEGQDHLVPAAEDKNTRGNETESVSLEHDGLASPHIEDSEHEEKEQDTSTILEVEEIPLKEAAITDETNAEARLAPAGGDESTHGTETGLVFDDHDGTEYPCIDKQKHDEKGKGRDEFLVEEMAIKEVSRDEKLELKDGDDEAGNGLGTITTVMTDLPTGIGAKCNGELPSEMNSAKNDSIESQNILVEASETELEDKGMVLSQKGASVEEESENGNAKQSHCQVQSAQEATEKPNGQGSEEGSKDDDQSALSPQFMMNGRQKEKITCLLNADCDSNKDCQFLQAKILENGHMVDASINHQKQQKDSQQEVQLVTDSSDTFFMDQMNKEESEEKKIIEEKKDSNPIENGKQCISQSYDPIEQMQGSDMAEVKQEPLWDLSEYPKPIPLTMIDTTPKQCSKQCANGETPQVVAIANGDYNNQRESVGRFSLESNPDTINSQMRKSPSFDLDLRIHARAEDSDQTPLLYQDKTTIESFSTQAEEKANTENGENPSQYESMATEEKAVTLERSDSEKSRTPFLGFLKEDEEEADEHNMLMEKNPKKQGNQSATNKTTTKVSTSVTTKGKVKRKPITAFFGTCMCCATVTN